MNIESRVNELARTICRRPRTESYQQDWSVVKEMLMKFAAASASIEGEGRYRITAEQLLRQLDFSPGHEGTLEILHTAIVNARADGHDEICIHRRPATAPNSSDVWDEAIRIVRQKVIAHMDDCTNTVRAQQFGNDLITALTAARDSGK